jgi:hypothetical protein
LSAAGAIDGRARNARVRATLLGFKIMNISFTLRIICGGVETAGRPGGALDLASLHGLAVPEH